MKKMQKNQQKSCEPVRVLHIDDDPLILDVTKIYLEQSGQIEVRTCTDANQAYELLVVSTVDVIISDYEMPDMDGIEFLKTIRDQGCELPFLLFTGRGREDVVIDAFNNGATSYIQKGGEPRSQFAELFHKVIQANKQYKSQHKISHLSRIFRSFREISDTLHGNEEIDVKLTRFCHHITSEIGYQDIRIILFNPAGEVSQVYQAGLNNTQNSFLSYIQSGKITSCMQKALLATNSPIFCFPDTDCISCPFSSGHTGFHTLTMRLGYNGEIYGIISVTLEQDYARDSDEQAMLIELSREVSYVIHHFFLKEKQNAMETLIQTNKKLDILNSITRHDIKNELTILIFHFENLQRLSERFMNIRRDVVGLESSLNNIQEHLMFSDVYQKIGMQKPKWLSISSIIENISQSHNFGNIGIIHSTGTLEVFTDPMFGKIIVNLVENALMHGCRVTTLQIAFNEQIDSGILIIEDDGMGIPDDKKSRIFERGVGKNTGLGLYYTREILGLTGMGITETGTYGEGARFEIHIPKKCYRWCKGEDMQTPETPGIQGGAESHES